MSLSPPPSREKLPVTTEGGRPVAEMPRAWIKWFTDLKELLAPVSTGGLLVWSAISKAGSNITDLAIRNHADLQNVNSSTYTHLTELNHTDLTDGGNTILHRHTHNLQDGLQGGTTDEYYHLTSAQQADLTDGGLTTLHQHDFHSILFPADDKIGTPTSVSTLQDIHDYAMSAGVISGCEITDNGNGTVAVAAGEAFLRSSALETATLMLVDVPATNPVSLTDNDANYIYADYSAGTPVVAVTTDVAWFNCLDKCVIAVVGREGTHLHIIEMAHQNVDSNRKHRRKLLETVPFAHIQGGCMLGTSGLKISLTAGGFWFGLERVTHAAFNTAGTDTISTYYRATPSGWTKTTGVTDFPNAQYDDASGTLATLNNNKFGVHWIYVAMGSVPHLALVYGQAEYASAAAAAVATEPESLPPVFESTTLLVGRIIFEKSAIAATSVDSAFRTIFGNSAITVHNNLSSLQGGTLNEYYHLTSAQATDLTDGGDSALHFHSADRALANITGLGAGVGTFLATPSSANLAAAVTDETGSGVLVFNNNPTLVGFNSTAASVISVTDNTNAALKITQLGTGNALLVEDSTSPDATPTVIDGGGRIILSHTAVTSLGGYSPQLQNHNANGSLFARWSADTGAATSVQFKSRSATIGSFSAVLDADNLSDTVFLGDDGTQAVVAGYYRAQVSGSPSVGNVGGKHIWATRNAAGVLASRMELSREGALSVNLGITSPSPTAGIGYSAGAGDAVTQLTDKATGVATNHVCGNITMNAAALAAGATVSFVLTDSAIAATDFMDVKHVATGTFGAYALNARCAAGSATIDVTNRSAGSLSEAIVLKFLLTKAVIA